MVNSETNRINYTNSKEWLNLICSLLTENKSKSTKSVTELLGIENPKILKENRTSKFLIPYNSNLTYIAINPDLENFENDSPITYLSFSGQNIQLKAIDLFTLFSDFELVENTYDGGFQLFFHPVKKYYDFKAVACELLETDVNISKLDEITITNISFLYKAHKVKTRAGYTMI